MNTAKQTYLVMNENGKIQRSHESTSLVAAVNELNAILKKDGSYWHVSGWRSVECDKSGQKAKLTKAVRGTNASTATA